MNELAECTLLAARVPAVAISLTQGKTAFVDPEDVVLVSGYSWHAECHRNGRWYARAYVRETDSYVRMHVLVGGRPGLDHKDRNGLNNTKVNLRVATESQNRVNAGKRQQVTSSRFKGVSLDKRSGRWTAYVRISGKRRHLGCFAEEEEAARVYDDAAVRCFGEFAATNASLGLLLPAEGA